MRVLVAVVVSLLAVSAMGEDELAIDFRATALDGGTFDASRLKGTVVLLDFWAVWCPPCIGAMPTLSRLERTFGERGFAVLGVAVYSGGPDDVAQFLEDKEAAYTVVVGDEDLAERFDVIGFPTYFLIDADGNLHKTYVGEMKNMKAELEKDIEALLSQSVSKD